MSNMVTLMIPEEDLRRFARNLVHIDKELESGPQIQRTHQHLCDLVKTIMDVVPTALLNGAPITPGHHSPLVASTPTPAVISRAPQVTTPSQAPASRLQLGRARTVSAPMAPTSPIEQPSHQTFQELGGGVVAVDGAGPGGVDPAEALAALQRVMPGAEATPVTATGRAMSNALAHPLPNADAPR